MSLYGKRCTRFQTRDRMVIDITLVRQGNETHVSNVTDNTPCHRLIGLNYRFCSLGMLRFL